VQRDIAERVLGHAIAGVEGIYDRHDWMDEKADALDRLAKHVERIVQTQVPEEHNQVLSQGSEWRQSGQTTLLTVLMDNKSICGHSNGQRG